MIVTDFLGNCFLGPTLSVLLPFATIDRCPTVPMRMAHRLCSGPLCADLTAPQPYWNPSDRADIEQKYCVPLIDKIWTQLGDAIEHRS